MTLISLGTEGRERFGADCIQVLGFRAGTTALSDLTPSAAKLVNRPLWSLASDMLQLAGYQCDPYGDRETIALQAMQMGQIGYRTTFYSANESPLFASSSPALRPGDFPNLLSNLANKILDHVDLNTDYSYPEISALHPKALKDFKPALMTSRSSLDQLDELSDGETFKQLGMEEESLSYLFLRRFGNCVGLTPIHIANDDLGAFSDGLTALRDAWNNTMNHLVLDRLTQNETLLDGNALFSNRADEGSALNNNDLTSGGAPSDSQWGAMETLFGDMSGIGTSRRVRGTLNTCLVPTGAYYQEARRTFETLVESKVANTTANVGLYRGKVKIVAEPELRESSATTWYGFADPTNPRTATLLRAYFAGFGEGGRRESWFDPETKCSYVSLEGRMAVAVRSFRYAIRNVT